MTLPIKSTKTATRVVGEDVGGSSTHHDGLHERSGLDGTDESQRDQQRITAILPDAETAAPRPRRPARRARQLAEAGSGLQTAIPAPFTSVP
jgi:Spy/CpxP family protein refolding chaperone